MINNIINIKLYFTTLYLFSKLSSSEKRFYMIAFGYVSVEGCKKHAHTV